MSNSYMPLDPNQSDEAQSVLGAILARAIQHHSSWEHAEAEQAYRELLAQAPEHPDANHNLGVLLAVQLLRPQEALPYLEAALNANPHSAQFWFSYLDALLRVGHADMVRQLLPMAQAAGLQRTTVNDLLGRLAVGQAAESPVQPSEPQVDRSGAQRTPSRKAMQALADLFSRGAYAEGERAARAMVEQFPHSGFAWKALGTMLQPLGHLEEALEAKRKAAQLLPNDLEAQSNLGNALYEFGRNDEAVEVLTRVTQLNPQHAEAHSNLGLALAQAGHIRAAWAAFEKALALRPNFAVAWNYLSGIYNVLGMLDEGIAALRRALELKPDYHTAMHNLLFTLNYHPDKSGEEIYAAYEEYEEKFGKPYRAQWKEHGNAGAQGRRLKVGYVSPDFRSHSTRYFMEPLLAHHDSERVE
ncbi:tetratricopeptide repeat protein, partial [Acidovorax sp.]|uniref:tetratricopeptide repeat protein n=1 Tax=Acidovorax sp. TaxID=1872122 RepID=UPI0031D77CE5